MQLLHKQKATRFTRVCNVFWALLPRCPSMPPSPARTNRCPLAASGESPIDSSCLVVCQLRKPKEAAGWSCRGVSGGQHLRSIQEVEPGSSHPPLRIQHMALDLKPLPPKPRKVHALLETTIGGTCRGRTTLSSSKTCRHVSLLEYPQFLPARGCQK